MPDLGTLEGFPSSQNKLLGKAGIRYTGYSYHRVSAVPPGGGVTKGANATTRLLWVPRALLQPWIKTELIVDSLDLGLPQMEWDIDSRLSWLTGTTWNKERRRDT